MPLESPDREFFNAAVGYAQLGMFLEANEQLEKIDPFNRLAPVSLSSFYFTGKALPLALSQQPPKQKSQIRR